MTSLRPYQETAVVSALAALTRSGSVVLQMPTGAGKTRAATEIVRRSSGVVWFICHRQEIERQTAKAFSKEGIDFGIISPRAKPDYSKRVQIVSVAVARLDEIPQPSMVIWDECHHVPAESWAELHRKLAGARHLGLTATPERLDGKGLKDWFSELVVGPSISALVKDGYLSPFRYFAPSDPDLTAAKLQAGDYRKKDADAAMNTPVLIGDAVAEYRRSADGKRAIAFCTSVEASKALVDRFNDEGIKAAHVDGKSSDDERRAAVDALTSGEVKILSNVEVFTEGFDVPGIEAAILMRPTRSTTLLLQMIGRSLRYVDGKTAIIMDHAGLHRDHGWFANEWNWSIEGGAAKARRMGGGGVRRCPECKEVRGERVESCVCGYEFPTGREIGEYDGVLYEVRGDVPEGCETKADFADRCGVTPQAVADWVAKGMPSIDGHPIVDAAVEWHEQQIGIPKGCVSYQGFIEKYKLPKAKLASLIRQGMPAVKNKAGRIVIDESEACEWGRNNATVHVRPFWEDVPSDFITRDEASKMVRVSEGSIRKLFDAGLPRSSNGWVRRSTLLQFVRENRSFLGNNSGSSDDGETVKSFAKRWGVSSGTIYRFVANGLPTVRRGIIDSRGGDQWMKENAASSKNRPETGYEFATSFADRTGLSRSRVQRLMAKGMPHNSLGHPHIQRGLEWLRDNTNVAIPPEAWPNANDNVEYELITKEMHTEARRLLVDRPKKFGEAA